MTKTIPKKKKCKKVSSCLRKEDKQKSKEGERYTQLNAEFQRIARRDKNAVFNEQCKNLRETTEWRRLEISSRKLGISREHFTHGWA